MEGLLEAEVCAWWVWGQLSIRCCANPQSPGSELVELHSATLMQTVNKMWLIFLSWAYKALTSPSPREMFSPLFPVFVVLEEERGGEKKNPNNPPSFFLLFFFFLSFCLCQGLKTKHFFFHLCLCCPSDLPSVCMGEPAVSPVWGALLPGLKRKVAPV